MALDEDALLAAAVDADAVLLVDRIPGDSLVAGTPVGVSWSPAATLGSDIVACLGERVAAAITTGFERTAVQDVGYALRQLTDVATKALSPGINDPTTAVHALGHCSALLCELAGRDLGPRILRDEHDHIRVVISRPGFADLLELVFTQPRRYGATVTGRSGLALVRREALCCIPGAAGTNSKGRFVGLMAYLDPRGERNNRMPAKRWSAQVSGPGCRGTRVIWRKLDCLNPNLQMMQRPVRRNDTRYRRHALRRPGSAAIATFGAWSVAQRGQSRR